MFSFACAISLQPVAQVFSYTTKLMERGNRMGAHQRLHSPPSYMISTAKTK